MPDTAVTDAERERRIRDFQQRVETALRDNLHIWHQTPTRFDYAAEIVVDALGDQAAEMLADGTMLKALRVENGQVILETEPARELMLVMVASLRTMLDDHGAENYLEMEIKAPCVAIDVQDGQHSEDAYTLTPQRRYRPTPHEFRQRAEARLARVREWAESTEHGAAAAEVLALLDGKEQGRGE